jgi:signal transduction histidine kinase
MDGARRAPDGRALADDAHELGPPLAIVRARCANALRDPRLSTETRAELAALAHAADELAERTQALLAAAVRQERAAGLRRRAVDLAALVHEIADPLDVIATQRGVRLVVTTPPTLHARVDPRKFTSVASNLISNSLRHAETVVRVELSGERTRIWLLVADDGPGVAPGHGDAVFTRHHRGEGSPGAGIGLALVREHVDLHGGTVAIDRAPEGGALFTVELPR